VSEEAPDEGLPAAPLDLSGALRVSIGDLFRLPRLDRRGVVAVAGLVILAWLSTSPYRVQPDEKGVVLRFGQWVATTEPGLHVHLPYPIESALLPKVTQINQVQLGMGPTGSPGDAQSGRGRQMLTGDENIVEADGVVFWKIRDPGQFLFKVDNPELAVRIAAEGALRDVISRTPIQAAMSNKRQQIADETQAVLQRLLDDEQAGVEITQVQLQRVEPPLAVIDAFNDVQRARADQERARNEAEAYANDILPRARGDAERVRQEAEAYKVQVVNLAHGCTWTASMSS
jgi:membrane protease subunit HflK